jgi:type IV pilus assembly protein PilE
MMTRRISGGFTLIELLITVAIVAILGTIALPAYYNFLIESRRTDAHATLSKIQLAQENFRGNCKEYAKGFVEGDSVCGTNMWLKWSPITGVGDDAEAISRDGHYEVAISGANGNSYTLTATAVGVQADDNECAQIILTVDPDNPNGDKTSSPSGPDECWNE